MKNKTRTLETLFDDGGYGGCSSASCPAVYRDESGRIFIQGSKLKDELLHTLTVPDNEGVIELTEPILKFLKETNLKG